MNIVQPSPLLEHDLTAPFVVRLLLTRHMCGGKHISAMTKPDSKPASTSTPSDSTFTCFLCNGVFTKALTEAEASEQLKAEFPGVEQYDCELVCDDCFNDVMGGPELPTYLPKDVAPRFTSYAIDLREEQVADINERPNEPGGPDETTFAERHPAQVVHMRLWRSNRGEP